MRTWIIVVYHQNVMLTSTAWHRIFFSLFLIFLPTQLGYHFWPDWAMVLGRRVDYLSPTVFLSDILIFGVLFFWLKNSFPKILYSKQLLLFLVFVGCNIFFATDKPVAVYKWIKVAECVALGWYIVKTKPSLATVVFSLSIGVFYSSVLAIVQFILQHSVGGILWWFGERTFTIDTPGIARIDLFGRQFLRPYATFPHPNVLGGFLAATLPLVIFNFKFSRLHGESPKEATIFNTLTIVFGIVALLLTFSRSAIVVGVLGIGLSLWQRFKKKRYLFFLFAFISLFTFHFSLFTPTEESVVVRQQLSVAAVKLWQQSPLVGIGLGNFLVELPKALPSRSVYFLQPVHNIYLLLLSEVGAVGLFAFLWLILRTARNFRLSLLALLLLGLIDHYPITLQQGQLLLTLFLALNLKSSDRTIGR